MKILALLTDGFGGYGGIAQYNRDLATALASLDIVEFVRILPRTDGGPSFTSGKLHQHRAAPKRTLYSLRAMRLAVRYRPDVIFCGHLYMAPLAWMVARLLRRPFWLQIHGIEAWDRPALLTQLAAERADFITAVSRYTRRRFLSWARVAPNRVRVLPNTYDAPPPANTTKAELKRKYGLPDRRVLLTVSRIDQGDRYKGHDKVLAVLPELVASYPNLTYVIVGSGDDRARLAHLADEKGLAARIFFAGRVDRDALHDYYRLADAYVMPSTKEGFGIVFLEAAAAGLPAIGGNADGSVDALGEGVLGVAVDPGSTTALSRAISNALSIASEPVRSPDRFSRGAFQRHLGLLLSGILVAPQKAGVQP